MRASSANLIKKKKDAKTTVNIYLTKSLNINKLKRNSRQNTQIRKKKKKSRSTTLFYDSRVLLFIHTP